MNYQYFPDFDPNDRSIFGEHIELTENDMCWPYDISIPAGSYYRRNYDNKWDYTQNGAIVCLCCSGDFVEYVEPGPPPKSKTYVIV